MNKLPDYRAQLGRHGHNLTHDFSFTSGTGHLLTLMSYLMYPKDTISGNCEMFSRTQPLLNPANCEIDEYIDYFFVPLDMLMSGFGDLIYQVNEPYSAVTKSNLESMANNGLTLPVFDFDSLVSEMSLFTTIPNTSMSKISLYADFYGKDWRFFSVYRNIFHNYMNPNSLFYGSYKQLTGSQDLQVVYPIDMYQPNVLPLTNMALNCVYQHIYRMDDRENFDPSQYNIDKDIYDGTPIFSGRANKFFSLKYRPKHFDYFTSANVTPFVNSSNVLVGQNGLNLTAINNYLSTFGIALQTPAGNLASNPDSATELQRYSFTGSTLSNQITNTSLRSMFAVEKLLTITQRAKKTYDAQVLAHLGVEVPHDVKHEIIKIGTQHSQIKIGEVVSTAGTSDTPLGDIAGKGYSVIGDNGIKFTAPCHGIFIAIYSAVPRFRYYAPLPKHAQISNLLDFFVPEYEKLGQQPLFAYEGTPKYFGLFGQENPDVSTQGWQMRYEQYKRFFNRVSPAFVDTIVQAPNIGTIYDSPQVQSFNSWHTWTIVRRPLDLYKIPNTSDFVNRLTLDTCLCGADELNGLMAVDYFNFDKWKEYAQSHAGFFELTDTGATPVADRDMVTWNLAQLFYRDPLLHFCKPNFKVVNKMNDNTLPDFIG